MDSRQAREILRLYRPGSTDALDPQMAEALALVQHDPELAEWLAEQLAIYTVMRSKLKEIEIPPNLKRDILLNRPGRSRPLSFKHPAVLLAAAAAIMLLIGGVWYLRPPNPQNSFPGYRERMARLAQRQYNMDMTSTNLSDIREFLRSKSWYADYDLTTGLEKLPGEGCAALQWHGKKVSMICFDLGNRKSMYLFVASRSDVPNAPPPGREAQFNQVYKLMTASWSEGDMVYVLAGPGAPADLQPYLN